MSNFWGAYHRWSPLFLCNLQNISVFDDAINIPLLICENFMPPLSRLCRQPPQWEPKKPLLEERCLKGGVVALSKRPSYEIIREKWTSSALPLRKKSTLIIECTKKGDHWSPLRKQITYHNAKLPHIKTAL